MFQFQAVWVPGNADGYHPREQSRNKTITEWVCVWKKDTMKEGTSRKVDVAILSQLTGASSKYALINPLVWNWVDVVCRQTIPTQGKFVWTPSSSSISNYPCKRWAKRLHNDPGNLFCDAVLSWLSFWSWSRNTVTQNGGNQGPPERVFHNSLSINGGDNGYKRRPHMSWKWLAFINYIPVPQRWGGGGAWKLR